MSLEESIAKRRSVRWFARELLTVEEVGQLLWATQGITDASEGLRSAPSAGALYPLESVLRRYVVAYDICGLARICQEASEIDPWAKN